MTLIDQIRELIAEGETERSLDELYSYVKQNNADVIDNLVMLRSRMQNLQRSVLNGTMDDQSAALERAKINDAILKLLPQLTPEYQAELKKRREWTPPAAAASGAAPVANRNRIYFIAAGAILMLFLLNIMFCGDDSTETETAADQQPAATTEVSAGGEEWMPEQGTLLYNIMTNHAGTAVWESTADEEGGQSTFQMKDKTTWEEFQNDTLTREYTLIANTEMYITLHNPGEKLFVRIGETNAQYHFEDESNWVDLSSGAWITPPDGQ